MTFHISSNNLNQFRLTVIAQVKGARLRRRPLQEICRIPCHGGEADAMVGYSRKVRGWRRGWLSCGPAITYGESWASLKRVPDIRAYRGKWREDVTRDP